MVMLATIVGKGKRKIGESSKSSDNPTHEEKKKENALYVIATSIHQDLIGKLTNFDDPMTLLNFLKT